MSLTSIYGTVYNNAKYIGACLNSLIQALPDFDDYYELVIVDNYSTDGTFKILRNFAKEHKNVKLLQAKCSRGKGRDIALKNTIGDYVFYIDFDCVFEKEFGIIIEKLKKLCTKGTLWQYGFSTRDTSTEKIGGWKNLNYGEDWEFVARAISKDVIYMPILCPSFSLNPKLKLREKRYATGISYMIRKIKNNIDLIRGWSPTFRFLMSLVKTTGSLFSPSALMVLMIYPILMMSRFKYSNLCCNYEFVYQRMQFIFPEDVGLPRDWLFILWENATLMWNTIKKRVRELINRDKNLNFVFLDNKLVCARNPDIIKKYI